MAREATITQEEVNAVADEIRATGHKPTARGIREALGSGSMATVLKYFQTWQAKQVRPADAPTVLPPGLQKALVDFIGQEVASAKVAIETDLVMSQQANADLITESERQATTIDALALEVETLAVEKAELSGRMSQMSADLEESRKEADTQRQAAETGRTEQAKLQLKLEGLPKLEAEVEKLRAALDVEREGRAKAEQVAAVETTKRENAEAQVQDLQARLTRAETDARETAQANTKIREQAQAFQASFEAAVRDGNQARDELLRAQAEASELRGQLVEARANITAQ